MHDVTEDDDAYVIDGEEEEDWEDEGDQSDDPDQVAFVDDEGWFHADEGTINAVDEFLPWEDEEYAHHVINYQDARTALANARIAQGF